MVDEDHLENDQFAKEFIGLHTTAGLSINAPSSFYTTKRRTVAYQGLERVNGIVCIILVPSYGNVPIENKNLADWIDRNSTRVYLDAGRRSGKQSAFQL